MNKLLALATILTMSALTNPASAEHHEEGAHHHKGKMMEKMFEHADTNKDGKISQEEFTTHHQTKFTEMDTNKDGSLTQEEIKTHWEQKKEQWQQKKGDTTKSAE